MDCLHQQVLPARKRGWIPDNATASYNQTMPNKVKTWRQSPDPTLKHVVFSFGEEHIFQRRSKHKCQPKPGSLEDNEPKWALRKALLFKNLHEVRDLTLIFLEGWVTTLILARELGEVVLKQRFLVKPSVSWSPSPGETQPQGLDHNDIRISRIGHPVWMVNICYFWSYRYKYKW